MINFVTNPIASTKNFMHDHPFAVAAGAVAITVIVAQKHTNERLCQTLTDLMDAVNASFEVVN